jgi:uncharacterized protein YciI
MVSETVHTKPGEYMTYDDTQAWEDVSEHFPHMTIYYIFLLRKGPIWSAEETPELDALQAAHVANMGRLADLGKLIINGPLLDSFAIGGELRGIGVFKTSSFHEAQDLISSDPMVRARHLAFELHAWMVDKNILPQRSSPADKTLR